jgi:hypothetical protein
MTKTGKRKKRELRVYCFIIKRRGSSSLLLLLLLLHKTEQQPEGNKPP